MSVHSRRLNTRGSPHRKHTQTMKHQMRGGTSRLNKQRKQRNAKLRKLSKHRKSSISRSVTKRSTRWCKMNVKKTKRRVCSSSVKRRHARRKHNGGMISKILKRVSNLTNRSNTHVTSNPVLDHDFNKPISLKQLTYNCNQKFQVKNQNYKTFFEKK